MILNIVVESLPAHCSKKQKPENALRLIIDQSIGVADIKSFKAYDVDLSCLK